jgi:nucleoside diphosphate kinase
MSAPLAPATAPRAPEPRVRPATEGDAAPEPRNRFAFRNDDTLARFERHREAERSVVFVFLDPWAVMGGTAAPLLDRILGEGFSVLARAHRRLREGDAEQIYRKNRPISGTHAWHVAREVYGMGTSWGLLLHRAAGVESAAEGMVRIKGRADPRRGTPGQLRHDFRAPNRSLSLMHSSDDWESAVHEALVFFTPAQMERALDAACAGEPPAASRAAPDAWDEGMESVVPRSPFALLAALRLRALRALPGAEGSPAGNALAAVWGPLLDALRVDRPVMDAARLYLRGAEAEQEPLAALLRAPASAASEDGWPRLYHGAEPRADGILRLLRVLGDPPRYGRADGDALGRESGLLRDRWEALLFRTTLFDFDDFLS